MAEKQFQLKEPWITVLAIASVIIAVLIMIYVLDRKPIGEPVIQLSFSKEDIEKIKEKETIAEEQQNKVLKLYQSFKKIDIYTGGLITPVSLIQACEDKKRVVERCNAEIAKISKVLSAEAGITDAYLYVKASVSRGGASLSNLTENDSIYFYIDDAKQFGGHLLRSRAEWSRVNTDGIELLFNLNSIPFTHLPYNDLAKPDRTPNLVGVLNQPDKHYVAGFVSTLGYGKIFELKIGYNGGRLELK
ncbi:MAG: hypothetical protein HYS44_01765 [Candidatus Niyogibacteria bacterium]|nr:hypothetical protein [Candidatus Niyogibacteria bacterium]